MRSYLIPQDFDQMDRFGPFTLPQLAILAGAVLISLFLIGSGMPIWLGILLAIPILLGALYIMYKKVNGIPVYEFALVYMIYKSTPKLLIYKADNYTDKYYEEEFVFFEDDEMEV